MLTYKKLISILLLLLIFLLGCQNNNNTPSESTDERLDVPSEYGKLTNEVKEQRAHALIFVEEKMYTLPVTEVTVILENKGNESVEYGNPYYIDKLQDGNWFEVPHKEMIAFTMEAYELHSGESFKQEIALDDLKYTLTEGTYRIRKSVYANSEDFMIADTFELKE